MVIKRTQLMIIFSFPLEKNLCSEKKECFPLFCPVLVIWSVAIVVAHLEAWCGSLKARFCSHWEADWRPVRKQGKCK